jgi:hypothetical protein
MSQFCLNSDSYMIFLLKMVVFLDLVVFFIYIGMISYPLVHVHVHVRIIPSS